MCLGNVWVHTVDVLPLIRTENAVIQYGLAKYNVVSMPLSDPVCCFRGVCGVLRGCLDAIPLPEWRVLLSRTCIGMLLRLFKIV